MKILYLLSQKPDSTGSGFYTQAMIREALSKGHSCYLVAGIAKTDTFNILPKANSGYIQFETEALPFSVPGMSDVMPYKSSRFIDMEKPELEKYKNCFEKAVETAVETFKPDIIHSNHLWMLTALTRQICPDIPVVASCHGTDLRQIRNCAHLKKDIIDNCRQLDSIIALSRVQKKEIASVLNISTDKIRIAGSGFNDKVFYFKNKPSPPPVKLLYAGKLSSAKGVPILLQAADLLKNMNLPFHLSVAGSGTGDEYQLCRSLSEKLTDQVTLTGPLTQTELATLMRESHIFILPSFFEGLPLVLFEALASGCSLITTSLPGVKEILGENKQNFIRFINLPALETIDKPFESDIPDLVQQVAGILKDEIEKTVLNTEIDMAERNKLIRHYCWEEVFNRVESVYQSCLNP